MTLSNVTAVQQIYAAFGRGDIAAIVERTAENTHWDFNGYRFEVPWHVPVKGRGELPKFFEAFGTNVEMQDTAQVLAAVTGK